MTLTDYQRGIYDLQTLLRKYGVVMLGNDGMKKAYHNFLTSHNLKIRRPTKAQVQVRKELRAYGYPPEVSKNTVAGTSAGTSDATTEVRWIRFVDKLGGKGNGSNNMPTL